MNTTGPEPLNQGIPADVQESIRIIVTGGTFDKHYDEIAGTLTFSSTHLPEILKASRCTIPCEIEINQLIDSLEMSEEHRRRILESCEKAPEGRIIITHGTDTIVETARLIGSAELAKTIILTGAMVPYAVAGSDAVFNLGCSLSAVQLLPHGVSICMNGRIFPWDRVKKNRRTGVFELLSS